MVVVCDVKGSDAVMLDERSLSHYV